MSECLQEMFMLDVYCCTKLKTRSKEPEDSGDQQEPPKQNEDESPQECRYNYFYEVSPLVCDDEAQVSEYRYIG